MSTDVQAALARGPRASPGPGSIDLAAGGGLDPVVGDVLERILAMRGCTADDLAAAAVPC